MNQDTPVIFADGTSFYTELAKDYVRHSDGLFILAPSGSGKTYFVEHQTTNDWVDGDYLWPAAGADLSDESWNQDSLSVEEINLRSDVITYQAKKLGFWIVGSSNACLKPDAIVLPPWPTHQEYIQKRERETTDHGATSAELESVLRHRDTINIWHEKGVPVFESIAEAVAYITK